MQADQFLQQDPLLWKAYKLAKAVHQGRYRKNGQPCLAHCVAIACMLSEMGLDTPTVAAGLLHDVVDDTPVTEAELRSSVSQVWLRGSFLEDHRGTSPSSWCLHVHDGV